MSLKSLITKIYLVVATSVSIFLGYVGFDDWDWMYLYPHNYLDVIRDNLFHFLSVIAPFLILVIPFLTFYVGSNAQERYLKPWKRRVFFFTLKIWPLFVTASILFICLAMEWGGILVYLSWPFLMIPTIALVIADFHNRHLVRPEHEQDFRLSTTKLFFIQVLVFILATLALSWFGRYF